MMKGLGASDGYGIGRVMLIVDQKLDYTPREVADVDAELERFKSAVEVVGIFEFLIEAFEFLGYHSVKHIVRARDVER